MQLFGLDAEVLAHSERGDGRHWVLKVELDGRPLVVKLYGRKRDWLRDFLRDVGQRFLVGKSGMTPAARMQTERATLELWHRHGFRVPRVLDATLPAEVPKLRLVLESIEGGTVRDLLADPRVPLMEKRRVTAQCVSEWTRRHELALRLREPGLIQVHATFGHVLRSGDALVTFDFEVAWRRRDVERLVEIELLGFLGSFGPWVAADQLDLLLETVVAGYSPRDRLAAVARSWRGRRSPADAAVLERLARALERAGNS